MALSDLVLLNTLWCLMRKRRSKRVKKGQESGISAQSRYSSMDKAASVIHSFGLML